jgi:uncharacterized protein (DUF2252 family)
VGRDVRRRVQPESLAELATTRADPVTVLAAQMPTRLAELVPLRHERMSVSPFSFFRGAAAVMAADLAGGPSTEITVQLCGDAHLSNFGMFGSPERRLVFDINDFDETAPGPWEWDVKRLVTSLAVAARQNGYAAEETRAITLAAGRRYQTAMASFADQGNLAVWYSHVDVEDAQRRLRPEMDKQMRKRLEGNVKKAKQRDHTRSLNKLTEVVDGRRRFVSDPPILVPLADLVEDGSQDARAQEVAALLHDYAGGLQAGARELARSYDFVDMARKVVGVGSVGTRCWVVLLQGRDESDPLLLQVKEAQPSVLARHLGPTVHASEGTRVVDGQRRMQAFSDVFLGAQSAVGLDGVSRDFYVRQLQDWKGSAAVEAMPPRGMLLYGELCAWTLARAHARSGDRVAVAAYLGEDDAFARAISDFAEKYAVLNEQDHAAFRDAVHRDAYLGGSPTP